QHVEGDTGAADALDGERDGGGLQVGAARVDVGRVAQSQLHVDGRRDAGEFRELVVADEAAEAVGGFDVDVERAFRGGADRGDLRQRQVDGDVDRARAQVLEHTDGGRVRGGEL